MAAAAPAAKPPANPITTPMTYQQLQDLAASQAAATISGENAPLQAQVDTYGRQQKTARADITAESGQLLPYVQYSAQNVQAANNAALSAEQQVFAAAGTRMNQLKQQQASEAQQLAQQMGGPVATGDFTKTLDPYGQAMGEGQATGLLHALGNSMADTAEAQKFAGQVFPALITEQEAKSDSYFRDQIKTLQDQINQNAGAKSDLVNKNLNDLLQNERQFELNVKQQQLDKLKSQRDWKVQQQQIQASKTSQALSKAAAKRANVSLQQSQTRLQQEQQRLNYEIQHGANQDQIARQRLRLQAAEAQARIAHQNATAKIGAARVSDTISKDAASVVQAAMGGGKPVSMSHRVYIPKNTPAAQLAQVGKGGTSYWDPKKKQYFKVVRETMTPGEWGQLTGGAGAQHPIHDPNRLYDLVRGTIPQLGRKATINLIRAQTGQKNWSPGKKMTYTGNDLHLMPIGELKGLARETGYTGNLGRKANRQRIVDYLMHISPNSNTGITPGTNP